MASCSSSALRSLNPASRSIWSSDAAHPPLGWRAFLRNHAPDIAAMDLFVAPTIGFDLLYVLVIVRLERRQLVWINVTPHPTAEWIARQVTEAFPWDEAPRYLIRDGIGPTALPSPTDYGPSASATSHCPGSPWQNGFAERLIGSIRRECVDHIVVLGEGTYAESDEVFRLL